MEGATTRAQLQGGLLARARWTRLASGRRTDAWGGVRAAARRSAVAELSLLDDQNAAALSWGLTPVCGAVLLDTLLAEAEALQCPPTVLFDRYRCSPPMACPMSVRVSLVRLIAYPA